jgi:hypothetical protein
MGRSIALRTPRSGDRGPRKGRWRSGSGWATTRRVNGADTHGSARGGFRARLGWATLGFVLGAVCLAYPSFTRGSRVIAQWTQPQAVAYHSHDPYTLYVVEVGAIRSLFSNSPTHEIRIIKAREGDASGYGHYFAVSLPDNGALTAHGPAVNGTDLPPSDGASVGSARSARVEWSADGVSLETPSRHRIFIPKETFTGGR